MDYQAFFDRCQFARRPGASEAALDQLAAAFQCELPRDFRELWRWSDGGDGDSIRFLPLAEIREYASIWQDDLGYVPFGECNDSNPYTLRCREPLFGSVIHVYHDADTRLVCRRFSRFCELLATAIERRGELDCLPGDWPFESASRTAADKEDARQLLSSVEDLEPGDDWRRQALSFAVQLLGAGDETDLARVLHLGDEYTRRSVLQRSSYLQTPAAGELVARDAADFQAFVTRFEQSLHAAGVRTDRNRRGELRIQPGNHGLNLAMIYCDCRRPGAMDEWVARFVSRMTDD